MCCHRFLVQEEERPTMISKLWDQQQIAVLMKVAASCQWDRV